MKVIISPFLYSPSLWCSLTLESLSGSCWGKYENYHMLHQCSNASWSVNCSCFYWGAVTFVCSFKRIEDIWHPFCCAAADCDILRLVGSLIHLSACLVSALFTECLVWRLEVGCQPALVFGSPRERAVVFKMLCGEARPVYGSAYFIHVGQKLSASFTPWSLGLCCPLQCS